MAARKYHKESIRRFYDWLGKRLDSQSFYEQPGLDEIIRHGRFDTAHAVFEFGCGTGRLARQLLAECLPADGRYTAVDISPRIVAITRERLQPWSERTEVTVTSGSIMLDYEDGRFDRFVSTYVVDILNSAEAHLLVAEAHRLLREGGLLCLASSTMGIDTLSKVVMGIWRFLHRLHPLLTGGCRPIRLLELLAAEQWSVEHHRLLSRYGVALEVVIARRL